MSNTNIWHKSKYGSTIKLWDYYFFNIIRSVWGGQQGMNTGFTGENKSILKLF